MEVKIYLEFVTLSAVADKCYLKNPDSLMAQDQCALQDNMYLLFTSVPLNIVNVSEISLTLHGTSLSHLRNETTMISSVLISLFLFFISVFDFRNNFMNHGL